MTYCCFHHFSNGTVLSRLCFYEIMPEKTPFKVWRGPPDVRLRKGTVNKSMGCLAAAHRCIQHEISKWSAYYSLDCAKIQYIAFLCAVKITSPINKASQGIVRKKKDMSSLQRAPEPPFHFFPRGQSQLTLSYVCSMLSFSAHFIMDEHISLVYRKALIMRVLVL